MYPLEKQKNKFFLILCGILALHLSMMVIHFKDKIAQIRLAPPKSEIIKVKLVQEAIKAMADQTKRQIVQSEDSESSEKKKDAFLSDKDRSFERETMARNIDSFKQAALGNAAVNQVAQKEKVKQKKKANPNDLKLSDLGIAAGDPIPREVTRAPASEAHKGMENGDPKFQGLSATNDYVEEVAMGDFTHLNTVEYKFYGFYHRIRLKLEQFWGHSIQEKAKMIFRSGRRLPASDNLITSLRITMNENGEITSVQVLGSSGVKELDDAAIESFNKAGPFPNPPKDLLVNGKATIEWGFVVKS